MVMRVPVPRTWKDGDRPTYQELYEELYAPMAFLLRPPIIALRKTNQQDIPANVYVAILWNTVDSRIVDDEGAHSYTQNPSRITPKTAGWWFGVVNMGFHPSDQNDLGYRGIFVRKNGSTSGDAYLLHHRLRARSSRSRAGMYIRGLPFIGYFNGSSDYIEVVVWQNSGVTLQTALENERRNPSIYMRWFAR